MTGCPKSLCGDRPCRERGERHFVVTRQPQRKAPQRCECFQRLRDSFGTGCGVALHLDRSQRTQRVGGQFHLKQPAPPRSQRCARPPHTLGRRVDMGSDGRG